MTNMVTLAKPSDVMTGATGENYGAGVMRALPVTMIAGLPARRINGTTFRLTGAVTAMRGDGDGRETVTAVSVEPYGNGALSTLWGREGLISYRVQPRVSLKSVRLAWARVLVKNGAYAGMSTNMR